MSEPTICAGIVCYNEKEWINACIDGALKIADEVIITDGLYVPNRGVDFGDRALAERTAHSIDGTWEIVQDRAAADKRIRLFNPDDDMPLEVEVLVRDMQLQLCESDYFLIVDADEIWCESSGAKLREALKEDSTTDNWYLTNLLYWHTPHFYFDTKHMRLFRKNRERHFTGINEVEPHEGERILKVDFHHYGYIDPKKVFFKMSQRYTGGSYRGCGEWWWGNIYMAFENSLASAKELTGKNWGTLHPWGMIHPGFAADEWELKWSEFISHPAGMAIYFQDRGFDLSKISFV